MKDIFSELYKKVLSFFNNEAKEENSKETACNRLKLVLMQDRAKMEPALMEKMREEMIQVISRYVEIDKDALDLNIEAEGDSFALMLNIPVLRAKTREEVEAQEGIVIKDEDDDEDTDVESEDTSVDNSDEAEKSEDNAEIKSEETSEDNTNEEDTESDAVNDSEEKEEAAEEQVSNTESAKEEVPQNDETKTNNPFKEADTVENNVPAKQPVMKKKIKHQKDDDL